MRFRSSSQSGLQSSEGSPGAGGCASEFTGSLWAGGCASEFTGSVWAGGLSASPGVLSAAAGSPGA